MIGWLTVIVYVGFASSEAMYFSIRSLPRLLRKVIQNTSLCFPLRHLHFQTTKASA
jgi:hypothetical protein